MKVPSPQPEELATLILARHILVARAIELDATCVALTAMHEAPYDRIRPSTDDDETVRRRFREIAAQVERLGAALVDVDLRIRGEGAPWRRASPAATEA